MEETGVAGEKHWPAASQWQTLSHKVVLSSPCNGIGIKRTTLVMIGTDSIGRCKSKNQFEISFWLHFPLIWIHIES